MTSIFNEALVYLPRSKSYSDYDHRAFETNKKCAVPQKKENNPQMTRGASFVVGHKLRESKWFTHEEIKIFLAVVETGFIVEVQDEIFGVAVWTPGYEKSKDHNYLEIFTVKQVGKHFKVVSCKLFDFWSEDPKLRINNHSDRDNVPHNEEIVRDQIAYAQNNKQKWHNSHHFSYWCRYGPPQVNYRLKQVSDSVKWGNIGLGAGLLLLRKNRKKSNSK